MELLPVSEMDASGAQVLVAAALAAERQGLTPRIVFDESGPVAELWQKLALDTICEPARPAQS